MTLSPRTGQADVSDVASDVFAYGLAAGISVSSFLATVALLTTSGGRRTTFVFLCGFLAAISLVCIVAAVLASVLVSPETATTIATLLKLVLGVILLAAAWRTRPSAGTALDPERMTALMARFDGLAPRKAFTAGAALVALPRRAATTVLAGLAIGASIDEPVSGLALTTLFALTAGVLIWGTLAVSVVAGERSDTVLAHARDWFTDNASVIVFLLALVFGALFTGQALVEIVSRL